MSVFDDLFEETKKVEFGRVGKKVKEQDYGSSFHGGYYKRPPDANKPSEEPEERSKTENVCAACGYEYSPDMLEELPEDIEDVECFNCGYPLNLVTEEEFESLGGKTEEKRVREQEETKGKFYPHDIGAERTRSSELMTQAKSQDEIPVLAEYQILQLMDIAEKGLPDCYDSFDDFLYDFYPDFNWDRRKSRVEIQAVLEDERFKRVVSIIEKDWGVNMEEELRKALKEGKISRREGLLNNELQNTIDEALDRGIDIEEAAKKSGRKLKKGAKARQRGDVVFQSDNSKVKDNKDHYPINNVKQARNALARVAQHDSSPPWYKGSLSSLQKSVRGAVKKKYPSIEVTEAVKEDK